MKKLTFLFILVLLPLMASAEYAVIDGIEYILYPSTKEALLDLGSNAERVNIPASFIWKEETYSVTSIGGNAFKNCSNLTSITIPNSVKTIGGCAFINCSNLISVNISNGVKEIGESVFSGCSSLTSIEIPNSVTSIGKFAFNGCSGMTSVIIPNSVTSIGEYAFKGCSGLTGVTIPNSVTSIGNSAGCSSLKEVVIPTSVTSIGGSTFSGCSGLTSVTIPNSVTSIGGYAFKGCSGLTGVTIPNSVTSIGNSAFDGCSGLASVTIGNSVTSFGKEAFNGCTGELTVNCDIPAASKSDMGVFYKSKFSSVRIGDGVKLIGDYAFYACSALTSVTISNSVQEIGKGAFTSTGLTSVIIPSSVTKIGDKAFSGCNSLKDITNYSVTPQDILSTVFNKYTATLHVPVSSVEAYNTTEPWSRFSSIIPTDFGDIAINETNFPDVNFRNWLLSQSYGSDGVLTEEEIVKVTSIDVSWKSIQSLQGIEFFRALKSLDCHGAQLTSLDMSKNINLTYLHCGSNLITSLDVSKNTRLTSLYCLENQLTSLDLTNNTALGTLNCSSNKLASLDVSKNTALTRLYCNTNQITSLDVTQNTALTYLDCGYNKIAGLDVTKCTKLTELRCSSNKLALLDLSGCTQLTTLYCYQNNIRGAAMDGLANSLPRGRNCSMYAIYYENEGNVMTTTQVAVAKAKNMIPYYAINVDEWQEYEGSEPEVKKCATPTISFVGGKIVFDCETEGVEFVSEVTCSDSGKYSGSEIPVTSTYTVSVYAKKDGYEDSDVATKEITVGGSTGIKGDVNEDGTVNGTDIQEVINIIVNAE